MNNFTIKELSEFSGVKPHTIRIWEQRFTFLSPKRSQTLRRFYTNEELNIFLNVILLIQSGYKISQVAMMTTEEKINLVSRLNKAQYTIKTINELIVCMAEMDSERFQMVLDSCELYLGIHEMIRQVIVPFAEKVGLFQRLDNKSYVENLIVVKEIIKQKIHSGIEKASINRNIVKTIVLFVHELEAQELPLLYLHYLFQMEGFKSLYLGKDVAIETLEKVCCHKNPDYIITVLLEKNSQRRVVDFVNNLPERNPNTIFISLGDQLLVESNKCRYRNFDQALEVMSYVLLSSQECNDGRL
jgi:DNA-binding transcriptional MerR regulator